MTQSVYDGLAVDYDSSTLRTPYFAYLNARYREILSEALWRFDSSSILDVGCGTGLFTRMISKRTTNYVGVDLSQEMLKEALLKTGAIGKAAETNFLRADASNLPFKIQSLGAVVSVGMVLPHLASYGQGLSEISRVLCKGGRFILEIDNKWSVDLLHYFADALTMGKVFSYGFSNLHQVSRYIHDEEYEWDPKQDELPSRQKILLHKISVGKLRRLLKAGSMWVEDSYGVHVATLFIPKNFPKEGDGVISTYLRLVEWLDRGLSRTYPFVYLGGSLVVVGKKEERIPSGF